MSDLIPQEKIEEVCRRASIVEVVSDFVSLKKAGNHLGLCLIPREPLLSR